MAVQRCERYRIGSWEAEANVAVGTDQNHTATAEAGTVKL
jgi:hypothetical protein